MVHKDKGMADRVRKNLEGDLSRVNEQLYGSEVNESQPSQDLDEAQDQID